MICAKCEWIVSPLDDKARRARSLRLDPRAGSTAFVPRKKAREARRDLACLKLAVHVLGAGCAND
jgi:hypothetical protein